MMQLEHKMKRIELLTKCKVLGIKGVSSKNKNDILLILEEHESKQKPFLGICLGMQVAVIEFARNVVGWSDANSSEFDASRFAPWRPVQATSPMANKPMRLLCPTVSVTTPPQR